jgi:hypothetical protein
MICAILVVLTLVAVAVVWPNTGPAVQAAIAAVAAIVGTLPALVTLAKRR